MTGKVQRRVKKPSGYVSKGTGRTHYRKRTYKEPSVNTLQREVTNLINESNKRLRSLDKAGYLNEYASRSLISKLGIKKLNVLSYTKKGRKVKRIKNIRGLSITKLKAIKKITENFLSSETSTLRGIKNKEKKSIEGIKQLLSDEQKGLVTTDDAKTYYDMFEDKDFNTLTEKIKASELWVFIDIAEEGNYSEKQWVDLLESTAITINDEDIRKSAINVYKKYVE